MTTTVTPLEAALRYAELGWPVVPLFTPVNGVCDCPDTYKARRDCKPGKHPRTNHGLDDATTDEAKIRRWWSMWPHANVGINLKTAGLVDIAPDSLEWHAEFIARGLPPTWSFRSGGGDGHEHHLYLRPPDCPTYRSCKTDEYDVMANGYAVMPPSIHASGARYTWLREPGTIDQATAPTWAVGMIQAEYGDRSHSNGAVHTVDLSAAAAPPELTGDALARWCGDTVTLKEDGTVDRSLSLWAIGRDLAKAGASLETIASELRDRDVALGWNKYVGRRDSLTRYVVIAQRALEDKPPARLTGRTGRKVVDDPTPEEIEEERYKFVVRSAVEFLSAEFPVIEWIVPGLLREQGIVGNFGGPGSLKTYFATQLALTVALGPPRMFLDFEVKRARVLIVQEDTPESDYQQVYLRPMVSAMKIPHDALEGWLYVATSNDLLLDDQDRLAALDAWMSEHKPELLVLDSFYLLHEGEGMTAKDLGPVLRSLKRLRKKHGCAIWIIDHNRKQPGKGADDADPIDHWYGGRPKSAATDGAIESKPVPGQDDAVELRVVKMRGGQKLLPPFQVRIQDGMLHAFNTSEAVSEAASKTYNWLLEQPVSRTVKEIIDGTKIRERAVRDAIRSLSERGWIEPGELIGERPHQQKTWLAIRAAGLDPESDDA